MSQPWDGGAGMLHGLVVMVLSGRRTPEVTVVWVCEPVRGLDGVGVMGVRSSLLELLLTCGMLCQTKIPGMVIISSHSSL